MTFMLWATASAVVLVVSVLFLVRSQRHADVLYIRKLALLHGYRMRPGWEGRDAPRRGWRRRMIHFLRARGSAR